MVSQKIRSIAPEQDPLRMGMGWTVEDLSKPQIMVESTFGDSHPGSAHLLELVEEAAALARENMERNWQSRRSAAWRKPAAKLPGISPRTSATVWRKGMTASITPLPAGIPLPI